MLLHGKLGLAYFQTFGGLLVSIWVSLLQCRIDRTNAEPDPRQGQSKVRMREARCRPSGFLRRRGSIDAP
ncbi:hypothetical protein CF68_30900 [Cupriavidus sp. SK-4]|nr:hypothetical protein CF68_30900 [Cupriavidus sp. SK-4]